MQPLLSMIRHLGVTLRLSKDGAAILTDLYGSKAKALKQLRDIAPSVDKKSLDALATIAAASALTVLARGERQALGLARRFSRQLGASGGGLLWHDRLGSR